MYVTAAAAHYKIDKLEFAWATAVPQRDGFHLLESDSLFLTTFEPIFLFFSAFFLPKSKNFIFNNFHFNVKLLMEAMVAI